MASFDSPKKNVCSFGVLTCTSTHLRWACCTRLLSLELLDMIFENGPFRDESQWCSETETFSFLLFWVCRLRQLIILCRGGVARRHWNRSSVDSHDSQTCLASTQSIWSTACDRKMRVWRRRRKVCCSVWSAQAFNQLCVDTPFLGPCDYIEINDDTCICSRFCLGCVIPYSCIFLYELELDELQVCMRANADESQYCYNLNITRPVSAYPNISSSEKAWKSCLCFY